MKIVLAIDSFKGCLTSVQAEQAASEGIHQAGIDAEIVSIPVSDGGEGMLDAFLPPLHGLRVEVDAHDAMMRHIQAEYGVVGDTAIIEIAKASGLTLIPVEERDAIKATSYGTGEIIADALSKGLHRFIIGLGGSATSDAGIGMLQALMDRFAKVGEHIDALMEREFKDVHITLASDVNNPLLGSQGAAYVFAPQKGATISQVEMLERRASTFADMSARHLGRDYRNRQGAGAAGGLGYAFMQYFDAAMESGAELLFRIARLDETIQDADMIITGEGSADHQTLMGKLPYVVLQHAKKYAIPVCLLSGHLSDEQLLLASGYDKVMNINPAEMSFKDALRPETAMKNIKNAVKFLFS